MIGWLSDLSLNLIAELIGIVATVFLVNRFLKSREDKERLPSKNIVCAKLMEIFWNIEINCLSSDQEDNFRNYYFGKAVASVGRLRYDSYVLLAIDIRKEWKYLTKKHKLGRANRIIELNGRLNDLLIGSAYLLENELVEKTLELSSEIDQLKNIIEAISLDPKTNNAVLIDNIKLYIEGIAWAGIKTEDLLENMATRQTTEEEEEAEVKRLIRIE